MSKKFLSFLLVATLSIMLIVGCSSDDDNPTGPGGTTEIGLPNLSELAVDIPAAMQTASSSNAGAANAVTLINLANSFVSYTNWLVPGGVSKIVSTADTTITWNDGNLTVVLTVTEVESMINWSVSLNGSDGQQIFEDFVFIRGSTELDGSSGNMSIFSPQTGSQEIISWSWATMSNGIFHMEFSSALGEIGVLIEVNPDGSGTMSQRAQSVTLFSSSWNADGSGSYTYYDGQGNITDSGSW